MLTGVGLVFVRAKNDSRSIEDSAGYDVHTHGAAVFVGFQAFSSHRQVEGCRKPNIECSRIEQQAGLAMVVIGELSDPLSEVTDPGFEASTVSLHDALRIGVLPLHGKEKDATNGA